MQQVGLPFMGLVFKKKSQWQLIKLLILSMYIMSILFDFLASTLIRHIEALMFSVFMMQFLEDREYIYYTLSYL